jgi:hypothetical protein
MLNFISRIKRRTRETAFAKDDLALHGTRRSSLIEFGVDEATDRSPSDFEICKGLVITLD